MTDSGAVNPVLQPVQFQQPATPAFSPKARVAPPLPFSKNTSNSTLQAAAWRTPADRVLSLGKATFGSTFRPFD